MQSAIDRLPGFAGIVGAERTRGRNRDEHSLSIFRIEKNRVQTQSARARLPFRSGIAAAQSCQFMPRFATISRAEQRRVFHSGVNRVWLVQRRLEMPNAFELPRMLLAIV